MNPFIIETDEFRLCPESQKILPKHQWPSSAARTVQVDSAEEHMGRHKVLFRA